ncbi:hypothetical protein K9N08_00965 [Candidatus Gracilibacteria bacterium]|nr:hypothetical protein [Candidatus Gracilibacteria bacterium]MCF7856114.1 hypothetical protein [Candidatus Gracilibacteria bacterium]MCF7896533.1 hypothetical protein [Candidatus Gracilibacteria bacterium]
MSPKTKISRKSRPAVKFTVRRIANRNPRHARVFHQFRRKLARTTAGLIAFGLLASGMWIGDGSSLQSALLTNDGNSACAATEITKQFEDLNIRVANINRDFPKQFANLSFCEDKNCAAEKKIYQTEKQLWQLNSDIAELEKNTAKARKDFTAGLAAAEDGILFCENEDRCQIAERALQTARICEKEFQNITKFSELRTAVAENYTYLNSKGKEYPASVYAKTLLEDISKNRTSVTKNEADYITCVTAEDASVCQKYVENKKEAEEKISSVTEELSYLKAELTDKLDAIDADIIAIQIGKEDSKNLEPNVGKGWCEQNLQSKKSGLSTKISASSSLKKNYETALEKLKQKKILLAMQIAQEIEATEKKTKAEIIFSIWSVIRNTF